MATRVTVDEVLKIVDEDVVDEDDIYIQPFINTANLLVTEFCVGQGYSDAVLADIEKWLSAHFMATKYNAINIKSEDIEGTKATYHGISKMGLESTMYGQQVKLIDFKSALDRLGKKTASFEVLDFIDGGT